VSQLLQLPFRAGIDEGTDPKQLPPGTLKVGENVRQDKLGRIRKRFGITALGMGDGDLSGANIEAQRIIRGGKAIVVADTAELAVDSDGDWKRIDRIPTLASTFVPIADTTRTTTQATTLIKTWTSSSNTYRVTVYSTGLTGYSAPANGALYVMVDNYETGAILMPPTLVDSSANYPRLFNGDPTTAFVYIAYVTAAGSLRQRPLNVGTGELGAAVALKAGVTIWDGVMLPGSNGATIVFAAVTATGVHIERGPIATGVMTHSVNPSGAATYTAIAIEVDDADNVVSALYSDTTPNTYMTTRFASDLTAVAAPLAIVSAEGQALAVKDLGAGSALIAVTTIDATFFHLKTASYVIDQTTLNITGTTGSEITYHATIASRIFTIGSRYYMAATVAVIPPSIATTNDTAVSPHSAIVLELQPTLSTPTTEPPHRRAATLEARTSALQLNVVTQPSVDVEGRYHLAVARKQREPAEGITEDIPLSAVIHRLEDLGEGWGASMPFGPSALVAASSPFFNDGASTYPLGFIHEPDIVDWSVGAAASGSMATGDYLYCFVYEWRDARGVLHRSAPSAIVTVTGVNANGSVILRVACTSLDSKQSPADVVLGAAGASPVRIVPYRSEVGGSTLYRLTHEPTYNVTLNDPASASVVITDTRADSSITGTTPTIALNTRPGLYTENELAEVNPAAATTGTVHGNRAWLLGGDRRTLQFSKRFEEDAGIAPGFNEEFVLLFTSDKYWLASLDDKLIVGGDHLDAVFGQGPASDGTGIDWSVQRIHSDTSCTSPRSVVVIPPGLVYRSPRGFELLNRNLVVEYIGGPVEDTLESYPVVTSAVLVPDEQEVRFTCTNDAGDEGVVIVLNYGYRAWYVRKYWNGSDAYDRAFVDAALVDGTYYLVDYLGAVFEESTTSYLDDSTYVSMKASVPVYPNGAAGWHRLRAVQVIGESKTHHKLNVEVSRDFATSAEQTETFEDGSTVTTPGPLETSRVTLKHQKRQAAVVTIYDSAPDNESVGTGEGPILELLALWVEPKRGLAKVPAAKKG
jgi:hypothetical protein